MARSPLLLCVVTLLSGCFGSNTWSTGEGQYCSVTDEDPLRVCAASSDLVCATTYTIEITNEAEARKFDGGIRPVWLCRLVCDPGAQCFQSGDVCCPANAIHGKTYGKTHVCVPSAMCGTTRDAGVRDTRVTADRARDTSGAGGTAGGADAGAADAPAP